MNIIDCRPLTYGKYDSAACSNFELSVAVVIGGRGDNRYTDEDYKYYRELQYFSTMTRILVTSTRYLLDGQGYLLGSTSNGKNNRGIVFGGSNDQLGWLYTNNIEYINCDVLELDSKYLKGKKKILMYEALQHFSTLQLRKLLLHITKLESGSLFMIGSVPDKKKLNVYYNTPEKLKFYLQREKLRKPHMGRWWLKKELSQLVSEYDLNLTILPQPSKLYTAYYRFNVLLEKC